MPLLCRSSRNVSEKKRRDKLNIYISELATMVPSCANSQRKLDKTTVLRMTVGYMKVHNGKIRNFILKYVQSKLSLRHLYNTDTSLLRTVHMVQKRPNSIQTLPL